MNSTVVIASTVRSFGLMVLLGALSSTQACAQPRVSIQIERQDFNGNLLKLPDGSFIVERYGELYRLTADGQFERKLAFDPIHPIPEITAHNTWFQELLAPLADGGFFAAVDIDIPILGSFRRVAQFDRDGRLRSIVSEIPLRRGFNPVAVGVQLRDGRVIYGANSATNDFQYPAFAVWGGATGFPFPFGSTRALAVQGSHIIAAGNFSFSQSATQTTALLRLNPDLSPDSSFQPPPCKDVSQLAVQSDGRIIVRSRLGGDYSETFGTETIIFRLNADGSFDQFFFQTSPDDWQEPAFAIESNGDIIIVNSTNASEGVPRYPKLWRFDPDGTLKGTITMQYALPCCWEYGFDRIEFLADGSFLAHLLIGNDGPGGLYPHYWIGFKRDGQLHPSFPPSPFDFVNVYLSVTNLARDQSVDIEQSKDLVLWEQLSTSQTSGVDGVARFFVNGPLRMVENPGPRLFRVMQRFTPAAER